MLHYPPAFTSSLSARPAAALTFCYTSGIIQVGTDAAHTVLSLLFFSGTALLGGIFFLGGESMYVDIKDEIRLTEAEFTWLRSYIGYLAFEKSAPVDISEKAASISVKLDALATAVADLPRSYL